MRASRSGRGFTLIELIITIVVAGFLGAVLVNLLGTRLTRSGNPIMAASNSAQAESIIEVVLATYVSHVNANTSGTLAYVQAQHPANATLSYSTVSLGGYDALKVSATVGSATATTILTQARSSATDGAMQF